MLQMLNTRDLCSLRAGTDGPTQRTLHIRRADVKPLPLFLAGHGAARMVSSHARDP